MKCASWAVLATWLLAATALAHGPLFLPAPPPPIVQEGGSPVFAQPVGGGTDVPLAPEPAPSPEPTPGTTAPPATPSSPGPVAVGSRGGTTQAKGFRSRNGRRYTKSKLRPAWISRMAIGWTPSFASGPQGYARSLKDIDESVLTRSWKSRPGPTLVLVYDPSDNKQAQRMAVLDGDLRFASAARLFNTFKVDLHSLEQAGNEPRIVVYDHRGKRVGEVVGKRLRKALKLMETAYERSSGKRLLDVLPKVVHNCKLIASWKTEIDVLEPRIICLDCGMERGEVVTRLKRARAGLEQATAALDTFRELK